MIQDYFRFDGVNVEYITDDKGVLLFNAVNVAEAVGYSRVGSLDHHVSKNGYKYKNGNKYLTYRSLSKIAKKAYRTKKFPELLEVMLGVVVRHFKMEESAKYIAKQTKPAASAWPFPTTRQPKDKTKQAMEEAKLVTTIRAAKENGKKMLASGHIPGALSIADIAKRLGMKPSELADWLINEGYLGRYKNGSLKISKWMKDQGHAFLKIIKDESGERTSNVPRFSESGYELISNRIASQRESSVLSFAAKQAVEREKDMERTFEQKVREVFKENEKLNAYTKYLNADAVYEIYESDLIKKIKAIVAEVTVV